MKYHLKLKKALSYCGVVTATHQQPDVFIESKEIAEKALDTGYFELVEKQEEQKEQTEENEEKTEEQETSITKEQLEKMKIEDLKNIAVNNGIDVTAFNKKAEYIEAITALQYNNQIDYTEFQ